MIFDGEAFDNDVNKLIKEFLSNQWIENLEILKRINCIDRIEMAEIIDVESWQDKTEFDSIWKSFQQGVFQGLCSLDAKNVIKVCEYAKSKLKINLDTPQ